jgi:outer membrane protein assembly factor BamB
MRRFRWLLLIFVLGLGVALWMRRTPTIEPPPPGPRLLWTFSAPDPGGVVARPVLLDDAVLVAAIHTRGFRLESTLYAIDFDTGRSRWTYDPDDSLLATASTPVRNGDRLYFGEGMHANFSCRLFCFDLTTKLPKWTFRTTDHIEGGPVLDGDRVIFAAGNDGLYAVDAATGERRWNYRADLHFDATPALLDGRVYAGSGTSRKFREPHVVCLDAVNGQPIWRVPVPLPAWSTPAADGDRLFVSLGNGRLTESAKPPETPAGALLCLNRKTGAELWKVPLPEAVFGQPLVSNGRVWCGCRDGNLYAFTLNGEQVSRHEMGGPIIAAPILSHGCIVATSVPGRILCLDSETGAERFRHELNTTSGAMFLYASPVVRGNRLFAAAETRVPGSTFGVVSLSCLEWPGAP